MFTRTVGDPGRGERIAEAVLDDEAARAEIVSPITSSVMASTGLPADQQPFVAAQVDRLLRDPAGARTFIDPFAGEWARMLGEDDPRPSQFDLAPLVDELVATTPGLTSGALPTDRFVVPSVPLPRREVPGLGTARRTVAAAIVPIALAAAAGFAVAFLMGERRRALRRFGLWAAFAGAGWVIVPIAAVWAARRVTPGADAVVAIAVDEAVSGLRATALVMLIGGLAAFAASFAPAPPSGQAPSAARSPAHPRRAPARRAGPIDEPAHHRAPPPPAAPAPPADDPDAIWDYYS